MDKKRSGQSIILEAVMVTLVAALFVPAAMANDEFQQWKQQEQKSFQEYKDKRDKEFTAFLKTQWTEMQMLKGVVRDPKPKPTVIPVAKPKSPEPLPEETNETPPPVTTPVVIEPPPRPVPEVVLPPAPVPSAAKKGQRIDLDYYGTKISVYYDEKLHTRFESPINATAVSDFWSALSKADYDDLITQIEAQRTALQLNDWAYLILVNEAAAKIYPDSINSQALFTWFILAKAGYSARIAYNDDHVYLLVPSDQQIYAVPYFTFDKLRYYAVRFDGTNQKLGRVYTYDGEYPGTHKKLDMVLNRDMVITDKETDRKLSFKYEGKQYTIEAPYSRQRISFLNTYPQLDLGLYFNANVSAATASPLLIQLSGDMQGMSQTQAVNFLLRFVQTSLSYETDEIQFGKENYLFPEETLYYPYSDCEDRAILFSWLVKKLLGMEVVGLDYPGHVATAVHMTDKVKGDAITFDGKRYLVADPTYIDASIGMTMPDYKGVRPNIIRIQ
jgi:hypothetical protein